MAEDPTEQGQPALDVQRYVTQVADEFLTDALACTNRAATVARRLLPDDVAESVTERLAEAKAALLDATATVEAEETGR